MAEVSGTAMVALGVFDFNIRQIQLLKTASNHAKENPELLQQYQDVVTQSRQLIDLLMEDESLLNPDLQPSIASLKKLADRLQKALDTLGKGGGENWVHQSWKKLTDRTADRKLIDTVIRDIGSVKLDLIVRIQLAKMSISNTIQDAVQVSVTAIKAMDAKLAPLGDSYPKLAALLKNHNDVDGFISVSRADLDELLSSHGVQLQPNPISGANTSRAEKDVSENRIVTGAFVVTGPLCPKGLDPWRDANYFFKDNGVENAWVLGHAQNDLDSRKGRIQIKDDVKKARFGKQAYLGSENERTASSRDHFYSRLFTMLVNDLAQDLKGADLTSSEDMLAVRLQEFSLRFGNENPSENCLRTMSMIYWHSSGIGAQICRGTYQGAMQNSDFTSDETGLTTSEQDPAFTTWLKDTESSPSATPGETAYDDVDEDQLISDHEILLGSEAYKWLISVIQRTSQLNGIEPNCMIAHRENVNRQLQSITAQEAQTQNLHTLITSKRPPPRYIARFDFAWDLLKLLREEYECENPAEVVGQVVTLTGDGHSVQAATCRGYLEQVWPTTGSEFMTMLEDMITRTGQICKHVLPDGTQVSAHIDNESCVVEAFGTQCGLGDVAEQLLWISTALRKLSAEATGISLCSADLVPITLAHKTTILDKTPDHQCLGKIAFRVVHTSNPMPRGAWSFESDCWMELFRPCSVVIGYPIQSRNPRRPGLEIPLDIMAALIGADRITPFGHDLIIKGYSNLFYATEHHGDYIMWHLICNQGKSERKSSRISFADKRIPQSTCQRLTVLQPGDALSLRHIVGWTSAVRSNAGAPDVEYSTITSSTLQPPPQGWALDRLQITAGQYITVGAGLVRGKTRNPINTPQEDYIYRLLDMQETKFVLYDVDTRKAWLVNGLSTLLHLVRSHLAYAEKDELHQSIMLVKPSDLQPEGGRSGLKAAFDTLRSDRNRMLKLHRKGGRSQTGKKEQEYYYLEDSIKSILNLLEQIVDHQSDFRSEEASRGYRIKISPWAQLEGFDFMDVAIGHRRVSSRGMQLLRDGKGWSQLTRALEAPTLFGRHFGEILEPASADLSRCAVCHWNDVMPPQRDLLAVQMEDIRKAGRTCEGDGRLHFADKLCLDVPSLLFEPCQQDHTVRNCQNRILRVQGGSANVQTSTHPDAHPQTGAILLGMPQELSADESQEGRGLLRRLIRNTLRSRSLSEPPQVRASKTPQQ